MLLDIVILAAGKGTRMKSSLPKVLHKVGGHSLLSHVLGAAKALESDNINIIVGHGAETVKAEFAGEAVNFIEQTEQLGTGHAMQQALPYLRDDATVLILYGDVPLTPTATLRELLDQVNPEAMSLLTVELDDPSGYGRIIRNAQGNAKAIVEQKDANKDQLAICEINTGIMAVPSALLKAWLPQLSNDNAQGEYYLTDIVEMASNDHIDINIVQADDEMDVLGVNNRVQQAELERYYQSVQAMVLLEEGVGLLDPDRFDCRGELSAGNDVTIDVNCVFEGTVNIGNNVYIGPNCVISNCDIGDNTTIKANSVLEDTSIAGDSDIGPFARLRPGTQLAKGAKIGNFVETKKAIIGEGSKVNHLSYVGDAELGSNVNVGAGTITCNYDGVNKSKTTIGDGAFIGSNTALVAPVSIGSEATVGAGSTVAKDVAEGELAVARAKQRNISNWQKPVKK
ncbi:bifunctional UDP-N-acetylglucosamine diphosphorylase/glucosamine-1-phosphate N-acetyltransferase GlmU [Pseudoteredinibacter isoporae]|uniref:Bifunctional protein GlmU n=1 Tax=Pseudoteredinibacter isoporae TaxID=570281 RepID=A0A7X0JQ68_9GAMM|nr:bifunctional UDP-N-acetylglucosamine diphosphorylase/glucosamine-1-phosphate N-acetyltransferase GlmU [Pseudoteredinibacter isoporae]MBB6520205.1 bifunctional UDP-N-acetylglucosamine pyrophosphorylase/glucosamine-1-phosphate N-acetyltransferase [Pseudoteredinibacter isoporae]NHO85777.1 UDP-N-acetylglucosamine diphosphorylase/glucosamine-1-phosphate N-acetyltransferase [Pseudoteredinibacter isoporae]NIB25771.1 UDP-N-acetylglucosamine diphosphorylase/glucosamine-1-phosphate N-acetyltransferase 